MTYFFDQNLGVNLVRGMKEFGEDVCHLSDIFPIDTQDEEWLEQIGKKEWILVTRDDQIRRKPLEKRALMKYNIGVFFLSGKKIRAWDIIQQVVRNWDRLKYLAGHTKRPFAFRVPPSGIVNINRDRIF